MKFEIRKKYNKERDSQINPYLAIGDRSNGRHVFENGNGQLVDYSDEYFQENFTPAMQYPPCSLAEARVGDTVEDWRGSLFPVTKIDAYQLDLEDVVFSGIRWYRKDGYLGKLDEDRDTNARYLHKQRRGTEPLRRDAVGELIVKDIRDKINELIAAVNKLMEEHNER